MTPFLQFRLWLRRGPLPERIGALAAGTAILVLLGLALPAVVGSSGTTSVSSAGGGAATAGTVPGGNRVAGGTAASPAAGAGSAPGAGSPVGASSGGGPAAPGPSAPAAGATTASGVGGAGAGQATSGACAQLGASDQGVTASQIKVAVVLPELEGQAGSALVGLPSPAVEQAEYQAVFDYANRQHLVPCRKLVPAYYDVNVLDSNQAHAQCLQVAQDKPFAGLDEAFPYVAAVAYCLEQAGIPDFGSSALLPSVQSRYYPYAYSYVGRMDWIGLDFVMAAHQAGWFNGARKIGIIEESCFPEQNAELQADLARIGIGGSQVTTFDFGCPGTLVPPNETEQAVLQFKTSGVTHVIDAYTQDSNYFSKDAAAQDYSPKYGIPDDGAIATYDNPDFAPNAANFNGALSITTVQYGGENSHLPLNSGTQTCNQAMAQGGQPPVNQQPDAFGGSACILLFTLAAAITHDEPLTRSHLAAGLDQVGPLDLSFPSGPALFNKPGVTTGGEFWRAAVYDGSCPCFKVPDGTWKPNFT